MGLHTAVAGVPRWAGVAAYAVPLVVLPSGLWRLGAVFERDTSVGEGVYVVALSVVSELLAFTAVGLVAEWGERFPSWIPGLRGRRVPVAAALIPAVTGALLLTALWTFTFFQDLTGTTLNGEPLPAEYPGLAGGWEGAVFYLCYLPLLLWGPLLGVAAWGYYRRRCGGGNEVISAREVPSV
ncbi:hypothetical protein [Actinoplanes sp. G11-F43]|uniref:hypothetical protein n=1 Tax=Actinoplanes sp. G11-F43 TaxID=3424130 RepID=UPI003D33F340